MDEQEEALRARAEARIGSTLRGKYHLDRVLGIGGMATVFAATHRNQAELAVKVLHPELSLRDDLKKRFLREGYVANSVKHPGAVLVVDDDVAEDGSAFLVMELLRGATVEDLWERAGRQLSTRAVTALTLQLLDVLAAAHEKAIVHRDLKPANLFLTLDGTLKVLDFGIARLRDALGSSEHATRTGTLMGTPAFMAPEQAQAVADEIDGQTDVWAVGATMFTLMSGQLVHDGDNSSQLLIRAGTSRARGVASVVPGVEAAIASVVDRALVFEKPGRWSSAAEMRDALLGAATQAYGKPPGRDPLLDLLSVRPSRRPDSGVAESVPGTPRFVLEGASGSGASIRANDPTFATPVTPGMKGSTPVPQPAPATKTSVSGVQPPLQGLSTANPVSREASTLRAGTRSVSWSTLVAVVAVLMAVVAIGFALRSRGDGAAASTPTVAPAHETPPPSASAASTAPAVPSTPPMATPVAPAPIPTPSAVAEAPPPPKVASPPKAAPPPKTDCSTPFTFEPDGSKKWKMECLTH